MALLPAAASVECWANNAQILVDTITMIPVMTPRPVQGPTMSRNAVLKCLTSWNAVFKRNTVHKHLSLWNVVFKRRHKRDTVIERCS